MNFFVTKTTSLDVVESWKGADRMSKAENSLQVALRAWQNLNIETWHYSLQSSPLERMQSSYQNKQTPKTNQTNKSHRHLKC